MTTNLSVEQITAELEKAKQKDLNIGWIHGDPTIFWKIISCAVPLCGNDQTLLKDIFGNKIG
jgi:hypothetical protein